MAPHPAARARFAELPAPEQFRRIQAGVKSGRLTPEKGAAAMRFWHLDPNYSPTQTTATKTEHGGLLGRVVRAVAEVPLGMARTIDPKQPIYSSPLIGKQATVARKAVESQLPPANSTLGMIAFAGLGGLDALGAGGEQALGGLARRGEKVAAAQGYKTLGQALVKGERGSIELPNPFDSQIIPSEYPMTGNVGVVKRLPSSKMMEQAGPFNPKELMSTWYAKAHNKEGSVGSISLGIGKDQTDIGVVRAWPGAPASTYADLTRIPRERFFRKGIPINTMPVNPLVIYSVLKNAIDHPGMFTKETLEAALWQANEALNMGALNNPSEKQAQRLKAAIRKLAQDPTFDGLMP